MFQWPWIFLGLIGLVLMFAAASSRFDEETRLLWALSSSIAWAVWSLNAGNVAVVSNGARVEETYLSVMFLGAIFTIVMIFVTFRMAISVMQQ